MTTTPFPNPDQQAEILQHGVTAAIDLALTLKQLHWNVVGMSFQPMHEFLDVVIDHARSASDELAERMVTVGVPAVGQRAALSKSTLPRIPDDFARDSDVIRLAVESLGEVMRVLREAQQKLSDIDPVSEDLVIGILAQFEKDHWMLRSHLVETN